MELKLKNITKEEMKLVLDTSKSMREAIITLGISPNGSGSYRNIRKKIVDLGLEIPKYHFYGEGHKKRRVSNDDVFVENSTYARHHLKQRIINQNLIEYKCFKCGLGSEWQGERISLHLDHINGVGDDNRIENLRFLCPNCHSQTPTYGSRNNRCVG